MIHKKILNNHSEFFGSFEPPSRTKNIYICVVKNKDFKIISVQ